MIRKISFVGEFSGQVKRLPGFDKSFHTVPKFASDRAQQFLAKICHGELEEWGESIFADTRAAMEYRRKDISLDCEAGLARLEAKDFILQRCYTLIEDTPSSYLVETELLDLGSSELLMYEPFNNCIGPLFDRMRCRFSTRLSVEGLIDGVEDSDDSGLVADYPSDCEHCDVRLANCDAVFHFDSASLEVRFATFGTPAQLAQAYQQVADAFSSNEELAQLLPLPK
ncbi:hypothetical protein MLD52_15640 [Puniceicoccaceae bacterium K14]|nr:hypothetical protein [Puniceicoccaceae bacterium K14]